MFPFFFWQVFDAATAIGLWRLRARRAREGLPKSPFQVWDIAIVLWLLKCLFLLVMPWWVCHLSYNGPGNLESALHRVPPEDGHADVSFWYGTCVVYISFRLRIER